LLPPAYKEAESKYQEPDRGARRDLCNRKRAAIQNRAEHERTERDIGRIRQLVEQQLPLLRRQRGLQCNIAA